MVVLLLCGIWEPFRGREPCVLFLSLPDRVTPTDPRVASLAHTTPQTAVVILHAFRLRRCACNDPVPPPKKYWIGKMMGGGNHAKGGGGQCVCGMRSIVVRLDSPPSVTDGCGDWSTTR